MATIPLDQLRVASPCSVNWDHMTPAGSPGVRHCGQCDLNVYNISEMTRADAERFIAGTTPGSRTCIRFYRRADGTVLTRDCPVGLRAARLHLARVVTRVAALLALVLTSAAIARSRSARLEYFIGHPGTLRHSQPFQTLCRWLGAKSWTPIGISMGSVAISPPPPPPSSGK